jgi:hypothetical protein
MINKYLNNLHKLINQHSGIKHLQFRGPDYKTAKEDDLVWYYIDPSTKREIRILCCKSVANSSTLRKDKHLSPELSLPYPYNYLLKVWVIEVMNKPLSAAHNTNIIQSARKVLTYMNGDLHQQTENSLHKLINRRSSQFLDFCMKHKLLKKFSYIVIDRERDKTGCGISDKNKNKIPKDESLIAIGLIFDKVFEFVNQDGSVKKGKKVHINDALVVTNCYLSLASPNRAKAEQFVLSNQTLKKYSEKDSPEVSFLDWKGSKGFGNYQNHILSVLSIPIEKSLNFFSKNCEPGRVLCRYYSNPDKPLKYILGNYKPINSNINNINNLFQLGYLLGLYKKNSTIYILKKENLHRLNVKNNVENQQFQVYCEKKLISDLNKDDITYTSSGSYESGPFSTLFGVTRNSSEHIPKYAWITISELEKWWIKYYTKVCIPEFPLAYSSSENFTKLEDNLFTVLGSDFQSSKGGKTFSKSHLYVQQPKFLAEYCYRRLAGPKNAKGHTETIFESYDFAYELRIRFNELRHYGNTLLSMSGNSIKTITKISGRKSEEQTHTYIHLDNEAMPNSVKSIINFNSKDDKRDIKLISIDKISELTNLPATITSTGVCTQDINSTPCQYLNDFISQCFLCTESCHILGDTESVDLLKKDFEYQTKRLNEISVNPRLKNSNAMQEWFLIHSKNTEILKSLIAILNSNEPSNIIRYSSDRNIFISTDINTGERTNIRCNLSNHKRNLELLIKSKFKIQKETAISTDLLSIAKKYGLNEGDFENG